MQRPMKWYNFLIKFALFASAVLNALSAVMIFTGNHYEGYSNTVYAMFPSLKTVDIIYAVACIAFAVFAICTRNALARFEKKGPKYLIALYLLSAAASLVYALSVNSIVSSATGMQLNLSSIYASLAISAVMAAANQVYFKKREHMFVN